MRIQQGTGPLADGQVVAVIGGGPAGVSCAIALRRLAIEAQRDIDVVLYEGKSFRGRTPHYNQCAGVLSPPIATVVESKLGVPFPKHLVQRLITSYVLHSGRQSIRLDGNGDEEPSYAVRRVQFDDYLIDRAREVGVEVVNSRVVDLEHHADHLLIYADSESRRVAAVVGAFGLDDGASTIFNRSVGYCPPKFLSSIVTKVHPTAEFLERMGGTIHAFLPPLSEIEFGAMTPKGNHITINIAGAKVDANAMDRFLALTEAKRILPALGDRHPMLGVGDFDYFKGKFPVSLARGYYGDRFAIIGDAAGLIRPFKGKGVTAGVESGFSLATAIITNGISAKAFADFYRNDPYCREIRQDLPYARVLRWLASSSANRGYLEVAINLARNDVHLRRALHDSVSAHRPYKQIVNDTLGAGLVFRGAIETLSWCLGIGRSRAKRRLEHEEVAIP